MITLTPTSTPADMHSVYQLLAVIADPAGAKARFDELAKIASDAQAATEKAEATATEARQAAAEHDKKLAELSAAKAEHDLRTRALAAKDAELAKREAQLAQRADGFEAQYGKRKREIERLTEEAQVVLRQADGARAKLAAEQEATAKLKTLYESKLAKLREVAA